MNYIRLVNGELKTKRGDVGTEFKFQLLDGVRGPVDLTNKNVTLYMATNNELILQRDLSIVDSTQGTVSFSLESGDNPGVGDRRIEIVVVGAEGAEIYPSQGHARMSIYPSLADDGLGGYEEEFIDLQTYTDEKLAEHRNADEPHIYGGRASWKYDETYDVLRVKFY